MTKKEKIEVLTEDGVFHIFAIDHRDVLTNVIEEKKGRAVSKAEVLEEKIRIIQALDNMPSANLVDPFYFLDNKKLDQRLNMENLLIGVERFNYDMDKVSSGLDYLTTDISIKELSNCGCNMVKLFVLYNPEKNIANEMDKVILYVQNECEKYNIPFLLEPILCDFEEKDFLRLTIDMLKRLKQFNVDIYKILFPGNLKEKSYKENLEICKSIDELLDTPWILLSSGVPDNEFKLQLEIAGKAGCCGYAVGRSVWGKYICEDNLDDMKSIFKDIKDTASKHCQRWS
jgi:tagatose-1,6-bisphosphate aldolase